MCLRSIVMLCCMISVGAGSKPPQKTDVSNTIFTISFKNYTMACDQTREKPFYVTVQENGSLRLQTKFLGREGNEPYTYYRCSTANNLNNKIVGDYEDNFHTLMLFQNVTANMAGIWHCTIQAFKNNKFIQPRATCLDKKAEQCAEAHCFLKLHIRLKETPQNVLVNNMILPTSRTALAELYDHVAEYRFLEGDMVNVLCVPGNDIVGNNNHNITLQYDFAAQLNDMFKSHMQVPSTQGYGFRTKLQHEHDNTIMICNHTGPEDYTTVQVKFRLLDPSQSDNYEYIILNGSTARLPKDSVFTYLFFEEEVVNIGCDTDDTSDKFDANDCRGDSKKLSPLECVCYKSGRKVPVSIKPWSKEFQESVRLSLDLPVKNTVMELYDSRGARERHSWIYYEFNIGDTLLPNCTVLIITEAKPAVKYIFNGKVPDAKPAVDIFSGIAINTYNITFTAAHDNMLMECFVTEDVNFRTFTPNVYYKNITVLFREKVIPTTTTLTTTTTIEKETVQSQPPSTNAGETKSQPSSQITGEPPTTKSEFPWALAAIGVLMCVVLVCVFIAVCKLRKRNRKRETGNNYENIADHTHNEAIPACPPQWSHTEEQNYHVPLDRRCDNTIYAEPVRQPDDPYATPIPKSQRPPKVGRGNAEPTYAELNSPSADNCLYTNFEDPQYTTAKELYSQVIPKNERKNSKQNAYDNTFPDSRYVNSKNSEYVEPTYCQPHRK